jgi:hypothetical protein
LAPEHDKTPQTLARRYRSLLGRSPKKYRGQELDGCRADGKISGSTCGSIHGAAGKNLKEEIDDLADKGLILPIMKNWSHEVRELGNEGTHPKPGSTGTNEKDAKDVVEFLSFLMRVMYDLPEQIDEFRGRR